MDNHHASFMRPLSISTLALFGALLTTRTTLAARYYEEPDDEYEWEEGHGHLDLGFDGEGAIPVGIARSPAGNDVSGGAGFKVRVGDQFRFPRLRITPELEYGYDHLFATDLAGNNYAWDMHRVTGGARLGFGRIVVPTFYGHVGYGWRNTGDPTVAQAKGVALDAGFALDFHVVRRVGFGGHAEYATINADAFTPQWVALGLHGDVAF